jgi:type I restriction enzyme S subunit
METVEACLDRVSLPSVKLQTDAFKREGKYPIIDQGKSPIAGWTDDDEGLIKGQLPVIVFGDHSRALKYVDFPFVRGAEGTQILKPRADIDPLYFYYACRSLNLESRGYNRHFTLLKEQLIPVPDQAVQVRIAYALQQVEDGLRLQDAQLATAKKLKRTALKELFARGLRDEPQKETAIGLMPASWEPRTVGELCKIWSGGTPRKSVAHFWNGDIPWVSGKDLKLPVLDGAIDHVSKDGVANGTRLAPEDSVLLLVRGMGLAKDLPVATITRPMAFNQDVKALVLRDEYPGRFLRSAMYVGKQRLLGQIVDSAHGTKTLNLSDVESFIVAWPSSAKDADDIVNVIDTIEQKITLHHQRGALLGELLDYLLHVLMNGELSVDDLELSALSPSASPRRQARA